MAQEEEFMHRMEESIRNQEREQLIMAGINYDIEEGKSEDYERLFAERSYDDENSYALNNSFESEEGGYIVNPYVEEDNRSGSSFDPGSSDRESFEGEVETLEDINN